MKLGTYTINNAKLGSSVPYKSYKGQHQLGLREKTFPLYDLVGDWGKSSLSASSYTPYLIAPVYNILNFGADPTGETNSRQAVLSALSAVQLAGGGTVYMPEGTYTLYPETSGISTIPIPNGVDNLRIEGDGPTKTILNFRAWAGQNPADLILQRGNGFRVNTGTNPISGLTLRGFRASGNAPITSKAGQWYGDQSLDGWDINHKGIGIWGHITGTVIEDCEWDNWRGETLYSGGGTELGTFTIRRCVVRDCNGSAISMGGGITIEDSEIYAVLNGTECFTFGGQQLNIRRCIVEPMRTVSVTGSIGGFGLINHGLSGSSMMIEDCVLKGAKNSNIFLAEFAHNVTIQNNYLEDSINSIYAVYLGQYYGQPGISNEEQGVFKNINISNNTFYAKDKRVENIILSYTSPWINTTIEGNSDTFSIPSYRSSTFIRSAGSRENFIVRNNNIQSSYPLYFNNKDTGLRPTVWDNTILNSSISAGDFIQSYLPASDLSPAYISPQWGGVQFNDIVAPTRIGTVATNILSTIPEGYKMYLRRTGTNNEHTGLEIQPNPTWNTLTRGYMIFGGSVLTMIKNAVGTMDLYDWVPNPVRTVDLKAPNQGGTSEIKCKGQLSVNLSPSYVYTFDNVSGIAIGETVLFNHNDKTIIAHVPGVMEISTGVNFVATSSGTLSAYRNASGVVEITVS